MSPDIRPSTNIETPSGNELLKRTVEIANKALIDSYPILASPPFAKRLITHNKIAFASLEEMQAMEHNDKPTSASVLHSALSLCGVPKDFLDAHWFYVNEDRPYYQKSPDTTFYLQSGLLDFSHPDISSRSRMVILLGDFLIGKSLENAPTQKPLSPSPWKKPIKDHLTDVLMSNIPKQFDSVDKQKLESAQNMIGSLLDANIRIVARGAYIYVLLDGQTMTTFEYRAGRGLNTGIVEILSKDPKIKLRILARQAGIIGKEGYPITHSSTNNNVNELLNSITDANLKNRKKLLSAYLDSEIPTLYRSSRKKGAVNPERYPS